MWSSVAIKSPIIFTHVPTKAILREISAKSHISFKLKSEMIS